MKRLHLLESDPSVLPKDFWNSAHCEILVMNSWGKDHAEALPLLQQKLPDLESHVYLASSGTLSTRSESKWIALSKSALLTSAENVNRFFRATPQDRWGLALPLAHVGGLGILARAELLGNIVTPLRLKKWEAENLRHWQGELLSLVPTQVHDIIKAQIPAPTALRAVVVGGDRLTPALMQAGQKLGWPLLASYGLSECASQVATESCGGTGLKLLDHVEAFTDEDNRLWLESPSLFTGEARLQGETLHWHERPPGPWASQDRAEITSGRKIHFLGRIDGVIKIRGEKVDLTSLEQELTNKLGCPVVLLATLHARDGMELHLISEAPLNTTEINLGLHAHQRIHQFHVTSFPRTELGKIKRGELKNRLGLL